MSVRTFEQGVAVGVACAVWLAQVVFSWMATAWALAYKDFGGTPLWITRVTISLPWRLGVPVAGLAAIGWLIARPAGFVRSSVLALLLVVAAAVSYYGPTATVTALADAIK